MGGVLQEIEVEVVNVPNSAAVRFEDKPDLLRTAEKLNVLPEKKSGSRLVGGCCPAGHDSQGQTCFNLYEDTQSWYCFHCNQGGDAYNMIMTAHNCDFKSAVEWARENGLGNGHHTTDSIASRNLFQILSDAANFFHRHLSDEYREHLNTHYGLNDGTILQYQIGFAPKDPGQLLKHLRQTYSLEDIRSTGLLTSKNQSWFQGQYVFPYWHKGQVKYFIGRQTEETPGWKKGKYDKLPIHGKVRNEYLFGEDSLARATDTVFVAEGVTDCLIALQNGLPTISPITTQFKRDDFERVINLTRGKRVILVPDNEENQAGQKGAEKTRQYLLSKGVDAHILTLPRPEGADKIDLNEYVRDNSIQLFHELVEDQCKRKPRSCFDQLSVEDCRAGRFLDSTPPPIIYTFVDSLMQGSVGSVVSKGGVGKGFTLIQCGVGMATNTPIFGGVFTPGVHGATLAIFTEDPEIVLHHRLFNIVSSSTKEKKAKDMLLAINENLYLVDATGMDTRLTRIKDGNLEPTQAYEDLLALAMSIKNLRLIILDPVSRFYGGVENDNTHGTVFVGYMERLAKETGATVLISHHTSKAYGVQKGKSSLVQEASRGATGITNACRWQLNLSYADEKEIKGICDDPEDAYRYLVGRVTKKNVGKPEPAFFLERDQFGVLNQVDPINVPDITDAKVLDCVLKKVGELESNGAPLSRWAFCRDYAGIWHDYGRPNLERIVNEAIADRVLEIREYKHGPGRAKEYLALPQKKRKRDDEAWTKLPFEEPQNDGF